MKLAVCSFNLAALGAVRRIPPLEFPGASPAPLGSVYLQPSAAVLRPAGLEPPSSDTSTQEHTDVSPLSFSPSVDLPQRCVLAALQQR